MMDTNEQVWTKKWRCTSVGIVFESANVQQAQLVVFDDQQKVDEQNFSWSWTQTCDWDIWQSRIGGICVNFSVLEIAAVLCCRWGLRNLLVWSLNYIFPWWEPRPPLHCHTAQCAVCTLCTAMQSPSANAPSVPLGKSDATALQLHFKQCPFPNRSQFGSENKS